MAMDYEASPDIRPIAMQRMNAEKSTMANLDVIPEERLSAEGWERIFGVWCEANPAVVNCTAYQAAERLKALEHLWRAWRTVFANRFGYDKTMPEAVKAMDRSDKSLVARSREAEPVLPLPCCSSNTRPEDNAAS